MIFLLDIILGINLLWAYKSFKNLLSPPVLVGAGMFMASFVATTYYYAWKMDEICFETVFYLGGSTVLFTLSCLLFKQPLELSSINPRNNEYDISFFYMSRLKILLMGLILLGILVCYLKIKEYGSFFGSFLNFQDLLYAVRGDKKSDNEFEFPMYIRILNKIFKISSYIVFYFFSLSILSSKKNKILFLLCFISSLIFIFDGLLGGDKGTAFDRIVFGGTMLFFLNIYKVKTFGINKKIIKLFIYGFLLLIVTFNGINEFIGRKQLKDSDKSSLLSIYIGAEIKNFDIYIKGEDGNYNTGYWGGETFKSYYNQVDEHYFRPPGTFQFVGYNSLGNVYTQVYAFHKDFGAIGVLIMTFLIALVSMYIYNKLLHNLNRQYKPHICLFIYSFLPLALFMSFFSPRFTEYVVNPGLIKDIIFIYIFLHLFIIIFKRQTI